MRSDRIREEQVRRTLEQLGSIENMVAETFYDLKQEQQINVNIRVSKDVPPALFKPDPLKPGGWIANELTFRALKKDIFAVSSDFADLAEPYQCHSCKSDLDKQFWHMCPYCGQEFLK